MVKVISFKSSFNNEQQKDFISLKVQGGVEAVQSKSTGKMYLTAKTAYVPCTFDEDTADALIGTDLPGTVVKVTTEPYEYTVKDSGEVITLTHRYEYQMEEVQTEASKPIPASQVMDLMEA